MEIILAGTLYSIIKSHQLHYLSTGDSLEMVYIFEVICKCNKGPLLAHSVY